MELFSVLLLLLYFKPGFVNQIWTGWLNWLLQLFYLYLRKCSKPGAPRDPSVLQACAVYLTYVSSELFLY